MICIGMHRAPHGTFFLTPGAPRSKPVCVCRRDDWWRLSGGAVGKRGNARVPGNCGHCYFEPISNPSITPRLIILAADELIYFPSFNGLITIVNLQVMFWDLMYNYWEKKVGILKPAHGVRILLPKDCILDIPCDMTVTGNVPLRFVYLMYWRSFVLFPP